MKIISKYCLISFFLIVTFSNSFGQEIKSKEALKIFQRIEEGISNSSVDKFSNYFSSSNYISLANSNSGYFSSNQSYYVIKDYLSIYQPVSFKLTNIVTESTSPFAAGTLRYFHKGIRGTATVFITLQLFDNQWKISQITIN